ncbi:major strawberry allergen Fra a 1.08-like [Aristolochia californica]|uniref:major strawberry allergen Fra a 1.08-like n=1 Tax=Aristolochia californica TaxID=171875 RepID=UPI0035E1C133
MVAGSVTGEFASPIAPARIWKAGIKDAHVLMPKLLPQVITSLEILEGDGGAGTIKKLIFAEGGYVKDRVDVMDDEKYLFRYSVIEGGLLGVKVNSMKFELTFVATPPGGSISKLKVDYDAIDGATEVEEEVAKVKAGVTGMVKAVEAYLLANPEAYV